MNVTRVILVLSVLTLGVLAACKKESFFNESTAATSTNSKPSSSDIVKDSTLVYAKDLYLWYKNIPSAFNPRSYNDPSAIMAAIRQYSQEPGFADPVDKWSFAMKQTEWNNISSGIAGDFGLGLVYRNENDLRVKNVEVSSPAGKAGIHRGWRVTKINGNSNIAYGNKDFVSENVFKSSSTTFTFEKPNGSAIDIKLSIGSYQEQPIALDSVYTVASKKLGYMVFNSFLGDTSQVYQRFNTIFSKFAQQNVNDVVIDLRYNGGGYVSMQEKLANYLVKSAATGGIMMRQQFNDKLTEYNETTTFKKLGTLNLDRIFFIVSTSTASASELLINNLKPYMDVKLVGPANTHGKPVGFFPYPVGDWYIFPVSFRTVNKNGEGNYFNGIPVSNKTADGVDKDWGDATEASLASVLSYVSTGSFRVKTAEVYTENARVQEANKGLDQYSFKGAIDRRRLSK